MNAIGVAEKKIVDPETIQQHSQEVSAIIAFDKIHESEIELAYLDKQMVEGAETRLSKMTVTVQAAPQTVAGYSELVQLIDKMLPRERDSLQQMKEIISNLPTEANILRIRGEIEHLLREISVVAEEADAREAAQRVMQYFDRIRLDALERRRGLRDARGKLIMAGQDNYMEAKAISQMYPPRDSIKPVHEQYWDACGEFSDYVLTESSIVDKKEAPFLTEIEHQSFNFSNAVGALLKNREVKSDQKSIS